MILLEIGGGIVLLFIGGELAIASCVRIARRWRVAEGLVGLSLTALMTSVPEIFTNALAGSAAMRGEAAAGGIAVGNVLGSNVSNALLLGGIGLLWGLKRKSLFRPAGLMALGAPLLLGVLLLNDRTLSSAEALVLFLVWVFSIRILYSGLLANVAAEKEEVPNHHRTLPNLGILVLAGGFLWLGGKYAVAGALAWVESFMVPSQSVGAVLGLGTSLPELAVTISALRRGQLKILTGNILGSNILNPLVAMPAAAMFGSLAVPNPEHQLWWAVLGTLWFLWAATLPHRARVVMGATGVVAYFLYLGWGLV